MSLTSRCSSNQLAGDNSGWLTIERMCITYLGQDHMAGCATCYQAHGSEYLLRQPWCPPGCWSDEEKGRMHSLCCRVLRVVANRPPLRGSADGCLLLALVCRRNREIIPILYHIYIKSTTSRHSQLNLPGIDVYN